MDDELANEGGELSKTYFYGYGGRLCEMEKVKEGIGVFWVLGEKWMNVVLILARCIPKVCSFFSSRLCCPFCP